MMGSNTRWFLVLEEILAFTRWKVSLSLAVVFCTCNSIFMMMKYIFIFLWIPACCTFYWTIVLWFYSYLRFCTCNPKKQRKEWTILCIQPKMAVKLFSFVICPLDKQSTSFVNTLLMHILIQHDNKHYTISKEVPIA